ncbi:hypothetical protein GJ744_002408 [Endocarpon pusillum]|uniref:Uncharacterized protein n=1 Tax=Endocarpon pusillum TaxID=364733 RepID=A0A8H7AC05_9EURO|nr:hypothetical protein GJ744_002408 [Endocarpon pusillum]
MTIHTGKNTDSASIASESPTVQLPAYSESDAHSNAGYEMVEPPHSAGQSTYMTAEEEKAYLASRSDQEEPDLQPHAQNEGPDEGNEQTRITSPTPLDIHEQSQFSSPSAAVGSRGLQVPSCRAKVSSGFPYPDMLNSYGVSPKEWSTFTSEITRAAQLSSKDWTITVGASVATFLASGIFINWLGLIPAVVVGHHLRKSAEHKNLRAARDSGDLEAKLLKWNQTSFAPRGFLVRLDLPGDELSDLTRQDVFTPKKWAGCCGGGRHTRARSCGGGDKWAGKTEKRAQYLQRKAAKRGRIVIVPLDGVHRSMSGSSANVEKTMDQNPLSESEKGLIGIREV